MATVNMTSTTLENWVKIWAKIKAYVANVLSAKQDKLVSGTSIKTVNGQSLLGSGNIGIDLSLYKVVTALPTEGIDTTKIYLVKNGSTTQGDVYAEHIYIQPDNKWEKLGEYRSNVDLTPYVKFTDLATAAKAGAMSAADKAKLDSLKAYGKATNSADGLMAADDKLFLERTRQWEATPAAKVSRINAVYDGKNVFYVGDLSLPTEDGYSTGVVNIRISQGTSVENDAVCRLIIRADRKNGHNRYIGYVNLSTGFSDDLAQHILGLYTENAGVVKVYLRLPAWTDVQAAYYASYGRSWTNTSSGYVKDAAQCQTIVDTYQKIPVNYYASAARAGVVRVGAGLKIDSGGVLSATGGGTADAVAWANVTGKPTFATVATSGAYTDLAGTPRALTEAEIEEIFK